AKDIVDLLRGSYREIGHLFGELREILDWPSVDYQIYPRLRASLRIHRQARRRSLYPALSRNAAFSSLVEKCAKRDGESEELIQALDSAPWKNEQMNDVAWRKFLERLETIEVRQARAFEGELSNELLS